MQKLLLGLVAVLCLAACGPDTSEASKAIATAESGDPDAQFRLAMAYMSLTPEDSIPGVAADRKRAIQWLQRAAKGGNSQAMFLLGMAYSTSPSDVGLDFKEALNWFRRAEMAGHAHAAEAVRGLRDSLNIPARPESEKAAIRAAFADEEQTTATVLKGAADGDAVAARRAAFRLRFGFGVQADVERGNRLLIFAADHGDIEAQRYLAKR